MKKTSFFYLLGVVLCCMGCSQETPSTETQSQQDIEKLEKIASEYGFNSMPVAMNENFKSPLTEEYCLSFENKMIELRDILDNATEAVPFQQSRALSDRVYYGTLSVDGCQFPLSIYWDETFNPIHSYAIAQGTYDCSRGSSSHYNYLSHTTLAHVSTKESESRIPTLYFVMRCNYRGYYSGSGSVKFDKKVEFILKFNVNTLDLETTITVFEDGTWRHYDFEI